MYIRIPPMFWSSEISQNSAYKRNRKYSVLYAGGYKREKVQLEMKFSCKVTSRDENKLMTKRIQDNFSLSCTSVVKMLWKPNRNYANWVRFGRFRTFVFFAKIKTRWNFWVLFLKKVHQRGLLEQIKKKVEFFLLSPNSWKSLTTSLNLLHATNVTNVL